MSTSPSSSSSTAATSSPSTTKTTPTPSVEAPSASASCTGASDGASSSSSSGGEQASSNRLAKPDLSSSLPPNLGSTDSKDQGDGAPKNDSPPPKSSTGNESKSNSSSPSALKPFASRVDSAAARTSPSRSPSSSASRAMRDSSPSPSPPRKPTVSVKLSPSQSSTSTSSSNSSRSRLTRIDALLSAAAERTDGRGGGVDPDQGRIRSVSSTGGALKSSPALTSPTVSQSSLPQGMERRNNTPYLPLRTSPKRNSSDSHRRASVSPSLGGSSLAPPASPLRRRPASVPEGGTAPSDPSKPTLKRRAYSLSEAVMANLRPPACDPDAHFKGRLKRRKTAPAMSNMSPSLLPSTLLSSSTFPSGSSSSQRSHAILATLSQLRAAAAAGDHSMASAADANASATSNGSPLTPHACSSSSSNRISTASACSPSALLSLQLNSLSPQSLQLMLRHLVEPSAAKPRVLSPGPPSSFANGCGVPGLSRSHTHPSSNAPPDIKPKLERNPPPTFIPSLIRRGSGGNGVADMDFSSAARRRSRSDSPLNPSTLLGGSGVGSGSGHRRAHRKRSRDEYRSPSESSTSSGETTDGVVGTVLMPPRFRSHSFSQRVDSVGDKLKDLQLSEFDGLVEVIHKCEEKECFLIGFPEEVRKESSTKKENILLKRNSTFHIGARFCNKKDEQPTIECSFSRGAVETKAMTLPVSRVLPNGLYIYKGNLNNDVIDREFCKLRKTSLNNQFMLRVHFNGTVLAHVRQFEIMAFKRENQRMKKVRHEKAMLAQAAVTQAQAVAAARNGGSGGGSGFSGGYNISQEHAAAVAAANAAATIATNRPTMPPPASPPSPRLTLIKAALLQHQQQQQQQHHPKLPPPAVTTPRGSSSSPSPPMAPVTIATGGNSDAHAAGNSSGGSSDAAPPMMMSPVAVATPGVGVGGRLNAISEDGHMHDGEECDTSLCSDACRRRFVILQLKCQMLQTLLAQATSSTKY